MTRKTVRQDLREQFGGTKFHEMKPGFIVSRADRTPGIAAKVTSTATVQRVRRKLFI